MGKTPLRMHQKFLKTFITGEFFAKNRPRLVSKLRSYAILRYASGYSQKFANLVKCGPFLQSSQYSFAVLFCYMKAYTLILAMLHSAG